MPRSRKRKKKNHAGYEILYRLVCVILGITCVLNAGLFVRDILLNREQAEVFEELRTQTCNTQNTQEYVLQLESEAPTELTVWQQRKLMNPDYIGWIRIPDTNIDYPVCQTVSDPEYYLHRDFYGRDSSYGTPFLDASCSLFENNGLIMYGHHMKDGQMFADLKRYRKKSYFEAHRILELELAYGTEQYEAAAVIDLPGNDPENVRGWVLQWGKAAASQAENFKKVIQKNQYFDAGSEVLPEDHLLMLITCEYSRTNNRIAVIFRRTKILS